MKVLTVIGARPQIVKAAVVSRIMRSAPEVCEVLVHTGQHYDREMSGVFFSQLNAPEPDYNLGIGSGGHGSQTGRMLEALEPVLISEKPDCVLVYGDTNSTIAGALASVKLHIPVAHVEAGLRSFNRSMPEEINRVVTDHVSDLLFVPTQNALSNLKREGICDSKVVTTGDVMFDAVLYYAGSPNGNGDIPLDLALRRNSYVLVTIHRPENTDDPARLGAISGCLKKLSSEKTVVFPLHPRTRKALDGANLLRNLEASDRIKILSPLGYLEMLTLERNAACIVTDSGGVQKEAFFCEVPCVTLRDQTEWTELVDAGWNRLVSPLLGVEEMYATILNAISDRPTLHPEFYGRGNAGKIIVDHLVRRYQ